jgi:hypothetical protein
MPTLATSPKGRSSGTKIIPSPTPSCVSWALLIWLTECLAVMWPISWPRMPTSSASDRR